jgi:CheY-like chemotaxis protein/anti-sigma regulatory factor (Ser/Thr protein kinase)
MSIAEKVLIVDDEEANRDILEIYLEDAGYDTVSAEDGAKAWELLEQYKDFRVIVLDRMMPVMDGMAFMAKLNADPRFSHIPVVMQTAAASSEEVSQGINAGVFYYLTKPYRKEMLLALVHSAIRETNDRQNMKKQIGKSGQIVGLMEQGRFKFRTLEEVRSLAPIIAMCFPQPDVVALGVMELMVNAVEHGNLGINCDEKAQLMVEGRWEKEINRRLRLEEYKHRTAYVAYEKWDDRIVLHVVDEGDGFNFEQYLDIDPMRVLQPNGRGIALARLMSFDAIEYTGKGNEVRGTVYVKKP